MKIDFKTANALRSIFLGLGFLILGQTGLQAQCLCVADTLCATIKPAGGVCDTILPDATVGHPYDTQATFYMPKMITAPVLGMVPLEKLKVNGITGLPFGMTWSCDSVTTACTYYPQLMDTGKEVGCVTFCGAPLSAAGVYTIRADLTVTVDGGTLGMISSDTAYYFSLTVNPDTGSHPTSFAFVPDRGCDSLSVSFMHHLPATGDPYEIYWDWGNGKDTLGDGPWMVDYDSPGVYEVVFRAKYFQYIITEVDVTGVNNDWCGDVEEPTCTCGGIIPFCPDLYYEIRNTGSALLADTTAAAGATAVTWTLSPGVALYDPPYTISIFDSDAISADDNLGTFAFSPFSPGTIPFSSTSGTTGSLKVDTSILYEIWDTGYVIVGETPKPVMTWSADSFCDGDSVQVWVSDDYAGYQWHDGTADIPGETDTALWIKSNGLYKVRAWDAQGCAGESPAKIFTNVPQPPTPTFTLSSSGDRLLSTSSAVFRHQWCKDGTAIPGADGLTYTVTADGVYQLKLFNALDCGKESDTMWVALPPNGIEEGIAGLGMKVFPNPFDGQVIVDLFSNRHRKLELKLMDMLGRLVLEQTIDLNAGQNSLALDLSALAEGSYQLILDDGEAFVRRTVEKL